MKYKRFNDENFELFPGCINFSDGTEPFISYDIGNRIFIIIDGNGVHFKDERDNWFGYHSKSKVKTISMSNKINLETKQEELLKLGFIHNI